MGGDCGGCVWVVIVVVVYGWWLCMGGDCGGCVWVVIVVVVYG